MSAQLRHNFLFPALLSCNCVLVNSFVWDWQAAFHSTDFYLLLHIICYIFLFCPLQIRRFRTIGEVSARSTRRTMWSRRHALVILLLGVSTRCWNAWGNDDLGEDPRDIRLTSVIRIIRREINSPSVHTVKFVSNIVRSPIFPGLWIWI